MAADGVEANHSSLPRVWTLSSYRAGENTQIQGLASALGLPWVQKRLVYNALAGPLSLVRAVSTLGIDKGGSDTLQGPWPDLIISAGVKNEPVCRWIKKRSGGHTRLVFLGRVWAPYEAFDLIITTPQYRLPERENILQRRVTLHRVTPENLKQAAGEWQSRFAHLPSPRTGVLLGGDSGPYVLGEAAAERLVLQLNKACSSGGSALITTSARTRECVGEVLSERLTCQHFLHIQNGAGDSNPYLGILACADRFLVSGDSVAMLSEAAATGKPVQIFHLPENGSEDDSFKARAYRLLMRYFPQRLSRDVELFHAVFERGSEDDLETTLTRVRGLIG